MQKSLCSLFVLLFFHFNIILAQAWEPVCEQEICVQEFYDTGTSNVNDIANIIAQNFSLLPNGASGTSDDYAAWSTNTNNSFILFNHTGLNSAYEYRVRVQAKSPFIGKELDFGIVYGNDLSGFQAISAGHSVLQISSLESPSAEVVSEIFTISEIGDLKIAIVPGGQGTTQMDRVMIDDYVLERRALVSPTSVSFTLSESS